MVGAAAGAEPGVAVPDAPGPGEGLADDEEEDGGSWLNPFAAALPVRDWLWLWW